MLKKILFQTHWFLGISAGIVVAVVGVTGAAISFEEELLHVLNKSVVTVPQQGAPLSPPDLLAKIAANNPGKQITNLNVFSAPGQAARVTFAAEPAPSTEQVPGRPAQRRRGETRYVNPYTAELIGGKEL